MKNHVIDSPIMDYLYTNASADYMSAGGPPNPKIRSQWISNQISDELDWYDKQSDLIPEIIRSNPRINEISSLVSH